jgi:hypothetical protein
VVSEFIIHCNQLSTTLKLATVAASCFQHSLLPMASGAKIALMFALMAAMAMAAQAGSHTVSCTNNYCKPITVNGVVIGVGLTVDVLVDATLTVEAENILGKVVTSSCSCPSYVTGVELLVLLDLIGDLQVNVTACILPGIVGTILGILNLDLAVCLL